MKTHLKTIHEEEYSDKSKTIGVLLNFSSDIEHDGWKNSFIYVYNHERHMYIFFNTMIDMIDYLLYGNEKVKRAYLPEEEFDDFYDCQYIDGKFEDALNWT